MLVEQEYSPVEEKVDIMKIRLDQLEYLGSFGQTETEEGDIVLKINRDGESPEYLLLYKDGTDSVILPENPFTNDNQ